MSLTADLSNGKPFPKFDKISLEKIKEQRKMHVSYSFSKKISGSHRETFQYFKCIFWNSFSEWGTTTKLR